MRFSNINDLVEGLMKDVEHEKKAKKTLSTKEKALRKALTESKNAIDRNNHRGGKKLADYRRSFEELLESYYPGKPWYQITSVNIDNEFANGTTPEQLITKLVENIKVDKVKSTKKSATHAKLNESKSLKEGSLASKARKALQSLRSQVEENDMYEELDYDDFELEEEYSEIDEAYPEDYVNTGIKHGLNAIRKIKGWELPDDYEEDEARFQEYHKNFINGKYDDKKTKKKKVKESLCEGSLASKAKAIINQLAKSAGGDEFDESLDEDLPDGCTGKGCRCKGTLNGPTDAETGLEEGRNADKARKVISKLRGGMNEDLPDGCKGKGCGCKGTLNGPTEDETGLDEGCGKKGNKRPIKEAAGNEGGVITIHWTDNGTCRDRGLFGTPNSNETTTVEYADIKDLVNQLEDLGLDIYGDGINTLEDIWSCFDDTDITGGFPVVFTVTDDAGNVIYDSGLDEAGWFGDDEEDWDDEDWDDDYIPDDEGYVPDDDGYVPDEEGYMPEGLADTGKKALKKIKGITGGR